MNETANNAAEPREGGMVLRTEGLVKRYGKRTVVNDVSINVKQGEIVGLLGPNGAGKTTSFYMTTGLIVPNAGHIYLDDKDITDYPVYKRARAGIGYLPQEASVFRKLSVEDNILAVLEMTSLTRKQQMEKLESLIREFRLEKVRKNIGDRLSGGERRRTEIARCLAIDPKFIMLDEPFAGVDPIAVEDIQHIGASSSKARPRNWPRTRWCARSILPTASCCARRTSSASTKKGAPARPPKTDRRVVSYQAGAYASACFLCARGAGHAAALTVIRNHSRNALIPNVLQKAVFYAVKAYLLRHKRRPFALPFAACRI